jgi:hypothetical protein
MTPQKKNELEKREETTISKERSEQLEKLADKRIGFEDTDQSDIQLPRISITQAMSQQFKDGKCKIGQIWDNVSEDAFDKLDVIPLFVFKQRLKFVVGKGLVCRSDDALQCTSGEHGAGFICKTCPDSQWGEESEAPKCSLCYNFICIDLTRRVPCVVPMMRSATVTARNWISKSQLTGKSMFAFKYEITSSTKKSPKGEFCFPLVKINGQCSMEELDFAVTAYESLKGKKIVVDYDESESNDKF